MLVCEVYEVLQALWQGDGSNLHINLQPYGLEADLNLRVKSSVQRTRRIKMLIADRGLRTCRWPPELITYGDERRPQQSRSQLLESRIIMLKVGRGPSSKSA